MVASNSDDIDKPSPSPAAATTMMTTGSRPQCPPEKNNARRPISKHVPSRYLFPTPSQSTSTTTTTSSTSTTSSSTTSSPRSRRFGSPHISRSTNSTPLPCTAPKRSHAADRRRTTPPRLVTSRPQRYAGELSAAAKLLVTSTRSSTRSLSVSFQGEAFSLPISKEKASAGSAPVRKVTLERKRATPRSFCLRVCLGVS